MTSSGPVRPASVRLVNRQRTGPTAVVQPRVRRQPSAAEEIPEFDLGAGGQVQRRQVPGIEIGRRLVPAVPAPGDPGTGVEPPQVLRHIGRDVFRPQPTPPVLGRRDPIQDVVAVGDQAGRLVLEVLLLSAAVLDRVRRLLDPLGLLFVGQPVREQRPRQHPDLLGNDVLAVAEISPEDIEFLEQDLVDPEVDGVLVEQRPDHDLVGGLADAVEAADPLFDPHRVPGQVVVDEEPAELEIDSLGADLGGKQDVRAVRLLEVRQDLIDRPFLSTLQDGAGEPVFRQSLGQVGDRRSEGREQDEFASGLVRRVLAQFRQQESVLGVPPPEESDEPVGVAVPSREPSPDGAAQVGDERPVGFLFLVAFLERLRIHGLRRFLRREPGDDGGREATRHLALRLGQQERLHRLVFVGVFPHGIGDLLVVLPLVLVHRHRLANDIPIHPVLLDIPSPGPADDMTEQVDAFEAVREIAALLGARRLPERLEVTADPLQLFASRQRGAGFGGGEIGSEGTGIRGGAAKRVAGADEGFVRLADRVQGLGLGEGVGIEEVEESEEILLSVVNRRGGQERAVSGRFDRGLDQLVGLRRGVSSVVRLIDDEQVETGVVGRVRQVLVERLRRGRPGPIGSLRRLAEDQGAGAGDEAEGRVRRFVSEAVEEIRGADERRPDSELCEEFPPPLLPERLRAQDQEAARVETGAQLRPDEAGFDGLAETDFVGEENPPGRRLDDLDDRLELVGLEVGVRRLHAVEHVGGVARHPDMREEPAQFARRGELAGREEVQRRNRPFGNEFQLGLGHMPRPFPAETDQPVAAARAHLGPSQYAAARRVVPQPYFVARIHREGRGMVPVGERSSRRLPGAASGSQPRLLRAVSRPANPSRVVARPRRSRPTASPPRARRAAARRGRSASVSPENGTAAGPDPTPASVSALVPPPPGRGAFPGMPHRPAGRGARPVRRRPRAARRGTPPSTARRARAGPAGSAIHNSRPSSAQLYTIRLSYTQFRSAIHNSRRIHNSGVRRRFGAPFVRCVRSRETGSKRPETP